MGAANGNLGGIALIEEVTYGTTPGTPTWIWQHPMPSSMGLRREVIEPNLLSFAASSGRGYSGKYVDGDLVMGLDMEKAVCEPVLGLAGVFSSYNCAMGGGVSPDINSVSALVSYGGGGATTANNHEWINKGVKPNAIRFDINADTNSSMTLVGIGQDSTKTALGSAETPDPPEEANVFMPSDVAAVAIDGNTVCLHSATIEVLVPKTGFERRCMGGTMKEPITAGRPDITFTLNCDLDDTTDNDTVAELAKFVAGTTVSSILVGPFALTTCLLAGDFPALQEGQIDFTFSGTAAGLTVTTTATP